MTPEGWPTPEHYTAPQCPRDRLKQTMRSLLTCNLQDPHGRGVLRAKCFKIIYLCDEIEHDETPVPESLDFREPNLVRELVGLSDHIDEQHAIAFTRDRASVLEALLGRR